MFFVVGIIPYRFDVFKDDEIMYGIDYEKLYAIIVVLSILVFFLMACMSVFHSFGARVSDFGIMRSAEKRIEKKKRNIEIGNERDEEKEDLYEIEIEREEGEE